MVTVWCGHYFFVSSPRDQFPHYKRSSSNPHPGFALTLGGGNSYIPGHNNDGIRKHGFTKANAEL